jgi:hypothetical protein
MRGVNGAVNSPCVDICLLGPDGLCTGCLRTTEEIAAWPGLADRERRRVLELLAARREQRGRRSG